MNEKELRKLLALKALVESFCDTVDRAENYFNRPPGGQQVPFHGPWCGIKQLPSVRKELVRWSRDFKELL